MKTKFTPGPWFVHENFAGSIQVSSNKFGGFNGDEYLCIGIATHEPGCTEGPLVEPNAHLIAAAPDLYEALQSMVDWLNSEDDIEDQEEKALKALAKARGEDK